MFEFEILSRGTLVSTLRCFQVEAYYYQPLIFHYYGGKEEGSKEGSQEGCQEGCTEEEGGEEGSQEEGCQEEVTFFLPQNKNPAFAGFLFCAFSFIFEL